LRVALIMSALSPAGNGIAGAAGSGPVLRDQPSVSISNRSFWLIT